MTLAGSLELHFAKMISSASCLVKVKKKSRRENKCLQRSSVMSIMLITKTKVALVGPRPHKHLEFVMMCWKRASADMQSLGKHVEGMIHLKHTEALKTQESFLTFIM